MLGRSISLTDSLRKELERLIPTFAYVELAPEKMPSSEKTLSVLYETCKEAGAETGEDCCAKDSILQLYVIFIDIFIILFIHADYECPMFGDIFASGFEVWILGESGDG